nr:endo-1,4-beta-xylanase [uncultured Pedobacter sp.]
MKTLNKLGMALAVALLMSSCEKHELLGFSVDKPATFENQEKINAYDALKSYLNLQKNPDFKLGTSISIDDYLSNSVKTRLFNSNFNQVVLGYEMKHGAIVQNNGSFNFTKLMEFFKATEANGMSVYGHTLCWNHNQNALYLNKVIAPTIIPGARVPTWDLVTGQNFETDDNANYESNSNAVLSFTAVGGGFGGTGRALKVTNSAVRANDYESQLFLKFSPAVKVGEKYELVMDVRSDADANFGTQAHIVPYQYKFYDFFGNITTGSTWAHFKKVITVTADQADAGTIAFNLGKTATTYYFDNITLKKYNEQGSGNAGHAFFFTNPSVVNPWEVQVAYDFPNLQNGKEYTVKFVAKGSVPGVIAPELQSSSDYSSNSLGSITLGTDWKEYELKTTTTKSDRNRFLFSYGNYKGTVLLDNVKLTLSDGGPNIIAASDFENGIGGWVGWGNNSTRGLSADGEGNGGTQDQIIEKSSAEKKSLITAELTRFISAMVDTSKKYVKAWDVVNEPMDDNNPYQIKTGVGQLNLPADDFFWQDYMGKDFGVEAFKIARQHCNPKDLLFINDYGLETNLDKCKGLIEYANYIESKGAKVDGIGTQMHISTLANKAKIVDMFKLLAATGKMIKVSELDLGLAQDLKQTEDATPSDYLAQEEMYKYVIDKYYEIIPVKQQYGITLWSPFDSPKGSFWKPGEPIGLWTEGLVRKPAYQGVAEALKGK